MLRARSPLSRCVFIPWFRPRGSGSPFMGRPTSPFTGEGKAWVTAEEKEKNEREKKASRIAGSFFSFMLVPSIL